MTVLKVQFLFLTYFTKFPTILGVSDSEIVPNCPPESFHDEEFGTFLFPATQATENGVIIRAPCPYGFSAEGLEPISIFDSGTPKVKLGMQAVTEANSGAFKVCRRKDNDGKPMAGWDVGTLTPQYCRTIGSTVGVMKAKATLEVPVITPFNFRAILTDINFLSFYADTDYVAAQTLIEGIGRLLSTSEVFEQGLDPQLANQCFDILDKFSKTVHVLPGYKVTVESPHITVQTAQFLNDGNPNVPLVNYTTTVDNVKLRFPSQIIERGLEQNLTKPKLRITAFSEDLLFYWKEEVATIAPSTSTFKNIAFAGPPTKKEESTTTDVLAEQGQGPFPETSTTDTPRPETALGNWRVFNIELLDAVVEGLSTEFEYSYVPSSPDEIKKQRFKCVFWDETRNAWSTEGMESILTEEEIKCTSTHFTAFSVLIDPLPLPIPGSDYAPIQNSVHSNILSILSSIGSSISIVGLAGVIMTYALFRSLRRERSNRILLNLCVSLLFMHIMSISSSKSLWEPWTTCMIPAILLQYFLHSSLLWMLMEAHHMHQLLISVFVKPESRFLIKRSLIAWGIPLIIVCICVSIKREVYETGRYDTCIIAAHLSLPLYYAAYMAPIVIILFVNFCVFCRIFKVLYQQTAKQSKQNGKTTGKKGQSYGRNDVNGKVGENKKTKYVMLSPTQIKGSLTVMILLGVGWVVGLFAIGPFEVFFKYLFCITNAGQGALIFLFRVILHPQACREWRKALFGLNLEGSEVSTTSSTNINTVVNKQTKISISSNSPGFISASNSVENSLTPSNPDAKALANTLASMLRQQEKAWTNEPL